MNNWLIHWTDKDGDHNVELTTPSWTPEQFGEFSERLNYSANRLMALVFGAGMRQLQWLHQGQYQGIPPTMLTDMFVRWARDHYYSAEYVEPDEDLPF